MVWSGGSPFFFAGASILFLARATLTQLRVDGLKWVRSRALQRKGAEGRWLHLLPSLRAGVELRGLGACAGWDSHPSAAAQWFLSPFALHRQTLPGRHRLEFKAERKASYYIKCLLVGFKGPEIQTQMQSLSTQTTMPLLLMPASYFCSCSCK